MKSTNLLEVCAALNALCKIVTEDMIPAVVTDVKQSFFFLFYCFIFIFDLCRCSIC
jgi:hypothetical protein